jgi:hypothetical protein
MIGLNRNMLVFIKQISPNQRLVFAPDGRSDRLCCAAPAAQAWRYV